MKNQKNKIKIGIVDDDRLLVQLLTTFLESNNEFVVQQVAHSGEEFLESIDLELDILLLDLRLVNENALKVLHELHRQSMELRVIVLSSFYRDSFMGQMFKLGVHAFLPKEIDKEDLVEVILSVYQYGHYFSPDQIDTMRNQISAKTPEFHTPQKHALTEREIEVLQAICMQFTTREIAGRLFISPKTVETHKTNLLLKTGVKNSAGLIIYAVQNKLIDPTELVLLSF